MNKTRAKRLLIMKLKVFLFFANGTFKKDFIIEKQLLQLNYEIHFPPLPFYATQMINPFLNSGISANHAKGERLTANGEILLKGIVSLL